VLNLPWLIASVWIAGAVVLLSESSLDLQAPPARPNRPADLLTSFGAH